MMMHWFGHNGMGVFGMVLVILFWALVIVGFIYLIRRSGCGGSRSQGKETAEDILKKRYARGEIDKDEFDRIRLDLQS